MQQGNVYGPTNNSQYPRYITNDDELPHVGYHAKNVLDRMTEVTNGGVDKTVFTQQQFLKNDPRAIESPQNKIGGMFVNHVYPEGQFGQTFLGQLTSDERVKPIPTMSTFQPPQYGFY